MINDNCTNPQHEPPFLNTPGVFTHQCPGCGREIEFQVNVPLYGPISTGYSYYEEEEDNEHQDG